MKGIVQRSSERISIEAEHTGQRRARPIFPDDEKTPDVSRQSERYHATMPHTFRGSVRYALIFEEYRLNVEGGSGTVPY